MYYSIGQVSAMFNLPASTLRYYDRENLFPTIKRKSGRRIFSENEIEALRVIECLKKSGLKIEDIKQFIQWGQQGNITFGERKMLFEQQRKSVQSEIEELKKTLDMLSYKCWYYDQALKYGEEESVLAMIPDSIPEDIKAAYDRSHS